MADVYYMKPQTQMPDESTTAFANRVKVTYASANASFFFFFFGTDAQASQELICKKARLTPVPWDGYLK